MTPAVRVGSRTVDVTHPDKVYFPDDGFTKGDVVGYYRAVAPHFLRHAAGRPLSLQRFPDGIGAEGFYQKKAPDGFPDWIPRVEVPLADGTTQTQVTVRHEADLVFLVQQVTITFHAWTSRAGTLDRPDRMVFDLDPAEGTGFAAVRDTARLLRDELEGVGLATYPMVTGSSGVHVQVPLRTGPDFDAVRTFARQVADALAAAHPDALTTEVRKDKRRGRLFLDVARNAGGQTAVAPYSLRARPGAPAATPLTWDELGGVPAADRYTLRAVVRRLAQTDDPWKGMGRRAARLDGAAEAWHRRSAAGA